MSRRRLVLSTAVALAVAGAAVPAFAYWTTSTQTDVSAGAATLAPPKTISVTPAGSTSMTIQATTAPDTGPTPNGYRVYRGSAIVCSNVALNAPCTESGLTANTSYTYTVSSLLAGWESQTTTSGQNTTAAGPTVVSINRAGTSPITAGSTASWTVTFSKSVTGVTPGAFALATSGTSATVDTATGSGTTYTVTSTAVSGSGTIGLNLSDGSSIKDPNGTPVSGTFTGQTYSVTSASVSAPTITGLKDANSDTGTSATDGITKNQTPTVVGTYATNGATITLYEGSTSLGTATVTNGTWQITSSTLGEGSHSLTAKATVNGTASAASGSLVVVIDLTAPTVGAPGSTANNPNSNGQPLAGMAGHASNDVLSVSLTANLIAGNGTCSFSVSPATAPVDAATGAWPSSGTLTLSLSNNSTCSVTVTQQDLAGNSNSNSANITRS